MTTTQIVGSVMISTVLLGGGLVLLTRSRQVSERASEHALGREPYDTSYENTGSVAFGVASAAQIITGAALIRWPSSAAAPPIVRRR